MIIFILKFNSETNTDQLTVRGTFPFREFVFTLQELILTGHVLIRQTQTTVRYDATQTEAMREYKDTEVKFH